MRIPSLIIAILLSALAVTDAGARTRKTRIHHRLADIKTDSLGIPQRAIVVSGDASKAPSGDLVGVLYNNQDLRFNDPRAPRFLFLDSKGKMALGIGGYIKATMQYDFNGAIDDGANFTTYDIPVPANPALRQQFYANASNSSLFLKMVGRTPLGLLTGYVQTDFTGSTGGYGMNLSQAYISVGRWKAGLARSTFADPSAGVPTIDNEGPSSSTGGNNILIRYIQPITSRFSAAMSVELPQTSFTTVAGESEAIKQRVPDIPANIQYEWDGGNSHVRLSALLRNMSYRDLLTGRNRFATGWALQLSGMADLGSNITVYYQGSYGHGYGRYINDLSGLGFDLIPSGTPGRLKAPGILGVVFGLQYSPSSRFFMSASFNECHLYDQQTLGDNAYRFGRYVSANAFYNIVEDLQMGIEYLYGSRTNLDRLTGHANRIMAMLKVSF